MSPNRDRVRPHRVLDAPIWRRLCRRYTVILLSASFSATPLAIAAGQQVRRPADDAGAPPRFVHEVWTVRDGLPVNSINALLQSRDGYLWAATFDGLVRFDGVRFKVYNTGDSEGLPSNRIVDLIESRDGGLWMRTEQGHLVRFRDGVFTHFDADRGLKDNTTRVIYEDADGTLWVGTETGLGSIRDDRFVPVAGGTIRGAVVSIVRASDMGLWVGTFGDGVFAYAGGRATAITGVGAGRVLYEDPTGALWIGNPAGMFRYLDGRLERIAWPVGVSWAPVSQFLASPATGTLWIDAGPGVYRVEDGQPIRVAEKRGSAAGGSTLLADPAGHVWFAAGADIFRDGQHVSSLSSSPDDQIPVSEIQALLRDHEGSLWLGTSASGLHRLKPSLFTVYSEAEGVSHRNVYPVYQDHSGALWFGTWGRGLSRLADGAITNFTPEQGYPGLILSLLQDREGRLWVGTYNNGVWVCSLPELSCSIPDLEPIRYEHVYAVHQDAAGEIWLGTSIGLFRHGEAGWTRLGEEAGPPTAPVRVFQETRDGALWMGTNGGGLARYMDGSFTHIRAADGIPSDLIRSLHHDSDGWLWIGTEGRGLARIDPTEWGATAAPNAAPGALAVYRAKDGLFDEVIHQILEDDFGRLWMSTNRGIFWVARAELNAFAEGKIARIHSTAYTEREGLRNREANGGMQPAGIKARDGRLWFPTQDGAAVVDPANLQRNEVAPPVVIEQVVAEGRTLRAGPQPIALDADERDLQIDYTALSFMAPENMRFRYRLEGYDTDWVDAGARRTAFYTKVPPGRYTFRVIASNNDGVWNEEGAAIAFSVAPHFYETKTYYLVLAVTLGLLLLAAIRWRLRGLRARERELSRLVDVRTEQLEAQNAQLEAQAQKLTELDRVKSRFFANISHEFRTPLTLTIGPLEDLRSGLHGELGAEPARQLGMALRNARRLLRLVNQILDAAKLESGEMKLRARQADLVSFLHGIAGAFTPLTERKRIALRFDAPSEALPVWFDSGALEKVFANLLSNAFKFTPEGGTIALVITNEPGVLDDGHAVVSVTDSGPGIPPGDLAHVFERFYQVEESQVRMQPSTGIGLSLAKEYVELHGGHIRVESSQGTGTTFTVTLPLGRRHLRDDEIADEASPERPAPPEAADLALADGDGGPGPSSAAAGVGRSAEPEDDPENVTTVLVVDDDADVRAYIRAHLESSYRVAEAADGAEGIALARTLLPDLVISDVMMPGTDGYAVCRALRSSPETDFVPVILLTAKASTDSKVAGLEEGADDYVVKPFEMRELEARVANLIASRRRLRKRLVGEPLELHARVVDVTSADAKYLERVRSIIEEHLSDEVFGVTELADRLAQDRTHLYRRVRSLLDETPTDLIRRLRLERAAQLLAGQAGSVAEVAYAVGFKGVSYFCKCFRDAYGVTPSAYRSGPPRD